MEDSHLDQKYGITASPDAANTEYDLRVKDLSLLMGPLA